MTSQVHQPDAVAAGGNVETIRARGLRPAHAATGGRDMRWPQLRTLLITLLITTRPAAEFIACQYCAHRHHPPGRGHQVRLGIRLVARARLVRVAVTGRPIARLYGDGQTLDVLRTCAQGARSAHCALDGAAPRASSALGATRALTYTQRGESGASPPAAGCPNRRSRPRMRRLSLPRCRIGVARALRLVGCDRPECRSGRGPR